MLYRNQSTVYSKKNKNKNNSYNDDKINFSESLPQEKDEIKNLLKKFVDSNLNMSKPVAHKKNFNTNYYNLNWEDEFRNQGLSLEDDALYEYIDGDGKMAYEYFNGELPKTRISKTGSRNRDGAFTKDPNQKVNDELINLKTESTIVQKAWLANNKRINELIDIVEAQEKELKQLRQEKSQKNSNIDLSNLLERINKLERNNDFGVSAEDQASIEKLKKENQKLKEIINSQNNHSTNMIKNNSNDNENIFSSREHELRKAKQAHFFVLKDHDTPKLKKSDLKKNK